MHAYNTRESNLRYNRQNILNKATDKLLFLDHAHTGYMHKLLHSGSELQCCVYVCNSGQKEEMVTGSRPKGKISPEVTGSRSQPAQPSSGLSHATSNVPIAYSSGCCMSVIGSCCMSCWLRICACMYICASPYPLCSCLWTYMQRVFSQCKPRAHVSDACAGASSVYMSLQLPYVAVLQYCSYVLHK